MVDKRQLIIYTAPMMNATIAPNEIAVTHTVRPEVGREFLSFPITGWDEVKKLTKKVLVYDGRKFVFSCWNSDEMYCCFYRMLDGSTRTAQVSRR
jgi:hypothetical protein